MYLFLNENVFLFSFLFTLDDFLNVRSNGEMGRSEQEEH